MSRIINLFGGPGVGKSVLRAELFAKMKKEGIKVEEITEYAKSLTYEKANVKLKDQLLILAEQHHRQVILMSQVDFIITDSPINMGQVYLDDETIPGPEFRAFNNALFERYNNINIFLERNVEEHEYQEYGRNQSLQEAEILDNDIKKLLIDNNIKFYSVSMGENAVDKIYNLLSQI